MAAQHFIAEQGAQLAELCRRSHARALHLFGSGARDDFRAADSDLDFLVEFEAMAPAAYSQAFFALKEGLEQMFSRPVDLLTVDALRNPYLRQRVEAEQVLVYAA